VDVDECRREHIVGRQSQRFTRRIQPSHGLARGLNLDRSDPTGSHLHGRSSQRSAGKERGTRDHEGRAGCRHHEQTVDHGLSSGDLPLTCMPAIVSESTAVAFSSVDHTRLASRPTL
jgi:hypothetical protein